ncbi:MAG: hypothetical protein AB1578_17575 [Thermodesulfobacteriota bacterium]
MIRDIPRAFLRAGSLSRLAALPAALLGAALVIGGVSGARAATPGVAGGDFHSLALAADGTVYQWGQGQLLPQPVSGLSGVTAVAAGTTHSLALKADGTVWAWGDNSRGQLGDGTQSSRATPQQVGGALTGIRIVSVAGGDYHTLAVGEDGRVWAWGGNEAGQIGTNDGLDHLVPVQVPDISTATAVSAGEAHSAALLANGGVLAWGDNSHGQVGDGTQDPRPSPTPVLGLTGVTAIDLGGGNSGALRNDGTLWVWGRARYADSVLDRPLPTRVTELTSVRTFSMENFHTLAVLQDGSVWSWGVNRQGRLGTGTPDDQPFPVRLSGVANVTAVGGWQVSLLVTSSGQVSGAGPNAEGQLGDGTTTDRLAPVPTLNAAGTAPLELGIAPAASSSGGGGGGCFLTLLTLR